MNKLKDMSQKLIKDIQFSSDTRNNEDMLKIIQIQFQLIKDLYKRVDQLERDIHHEQTK